VRRDCRNGPDIAGGFQHTRGVPPEVILRRPTAADVLAVLAVHTAQNVALIGFADATLADVEDELTEPEVDLAHDSWLALAPDGTPLGWTLARRMGGTDRVELVLAVAPDQGSLAEDLWTRSASRAAEMVGGAQVRLVTDVYRPDVARAELVRGRGLACTATFWRMRIDHAAAPTEPQLPAGVTLRSGDEDEQVRRDALLVRNEAFVGHAGMIEREYDEWIARLEASSSHDWSLTWVAYVGGEPAGVLVATNAFVPDQNCGYVLNLGTRKQFQQRGLGSLLLRRAFAVDVARGRTGTILHVDTDPQRPALGLYERNGMRPVLTIDMWEGLGPCA
jgi:mycothiol synthase